MMMRGVLMVDLLRDSRICQFFGGLLLIGDKRSIVNSKLTCSSGRVRYLRAIIYNQLT